MMTCYFGYDNRRTPMAFGSCEKLKEADVVEETLIESAWWSRPANGLNLNVIGIKLNAAYTDGHVESFTPSETVPMKAIMNRFTYQPYPSGVGPGDFFIPR